MRFPSSEEWAQEIFENVIFFVVLGILGAIFHFRKSSPLLVGILVGGGALLLVAGAAMRLRRRRTRGSRDSKPDTSA
jgi:hypothetical protein